MGNTNIENVNHITITDPGGGEGIEWKDPTNNWKIVVSPDNLSNATGFTVRSKWCKKSYGKSKR